MVHQITAVFTASGWDSRNARLDIARNYQPGVGERPIYAPVVENWALQPGGTKTLTLAYRDTAARLQFICHMGARSSQYMPAGAVLTGQVSVDGRYQGQFSVHGTGGNADTFDEFQVLTDMLL